MLFTSNNTDNVIVYNSITNTLNDQKYDRVQPFSFIEFLNQTQTLTNNYIIQFTDYQAYLKKWNSVTTVTYKDYNTTVREEFIQFLRTIALNYTTAEEKRYLTNIDFNNNNDLEIAVPFFVTKIKQVLLYFAGKRDSYVIDLQLAQGKGSVSGITNYIRTTVIETLFGNDIFPPITSQQPLSAVSTQLSVEVTEGYDIFNDYFDLDPFAPPSFYNATGERAEYFTSNTNTSDPNLFLNFDQSIIDLINSERPVLQQLQSLVINVNTPNINLLQPKDFQNYDTIERSNLSLLLNAQLIQKFTGTDFYYLSSNSLGQSVTGLLFEATSPYANILNVYSPSTLSVPQSSALYERDVGLFFKPTIQSILQLQTPFTYEIKSDISLSAVYVFPDPNSYGNISGVSKTDHVTPFKFIQQGSQIQKNISSNNALANSNVSKNDFTFESYHSQEQNSSASFLQKLYNNGIATSNESDIYGIIIVGLKQQDTNYIQTFNSNVTNNVAPFGLSANTNILFLSSIDVILNNGTFAGTTTQTMVATQAAPVNSIYNTRNSAGTFIVYNNVNNTINTLSSQFANVFSKFPLQQDELNYNLNSVEIFGTTYVFTTSTYVLIDQVNFNPLNGSFYQSSLVPLSFDSVVNNIASNVYLNGNNLYIATLSATSSPLVSASNTRPFYLSFYSYNINNGLISEYNFQNPADYILTYNVNTLVNVTDVNLVYNKKQALFNVVITLKDLNNNIFLQSLFYRISNNLVSLVEQKTFAPNNTNLTINFFDNSYVNNLLLNTLVTTPTITTSTGTITF